MIAQTLFYSRLILAAAGLSLASLACVAVPAEQQQDAGTAPVYDGGSADAANMDAVSIDSAGQDSAQTAQDAGETAYDAAVNRPDAAGFDPDNPGIRVSLSIGRTLMLGQAVAVAAGSFTKTGREDLFADATDDAIPFESCVEQAQAHTPSCSVDTDCAPEQHCVLATNARGEDIADSEHCETPKTPFDVGPMTVTGFVSGPLTLSYNAEQNGGYTSEGGDGTIDPGELNYDTTYNFSGDGDAAQGLGAFSGQIHLAPQLVLTQPDITNIGAGPQGIEVNDSQDLVLTWDGSDPGAEVKISLSGATLGSENHVIVCQTHDAGHFDDPRGDGAGRAAWCDVNAQHPDHRAAQAGYCQWRGYQLLPRRKPAEPDHQREETINRPTRPQYRSAINIKGQHIYAQF